MENLAPIALFVYNRLEHTKKTIEALKKNYLAEESELFIFSDGGKLGDEENVEKVRAYIKNVRGFKNVHIIERENNWGLAKSVITGVTNVINDFGKIIVLEDDIVCSSFFLEFMNRALFKYQACSNVFSVSAYSYLANEESEGIPDTYFLKLVCSWSWATWKSKWEYFDSNALGCRRLKWDRKLRKQFNYDNANDWCSMLMMQMRIQMKYLIFPPKIDSWAIRWYWSVFKHKGLTLFPRESLVENIGFDGSGVHCGKIEQSHMKMGTMSDAFLYTDLIDEENWIREKVKRSLLISNGRK